MLTTFPLLSRIEESRGRLAIVSDAASFQFDDILNASTHLAEHLTRHRGESLLGTRIALWCAPGFDFVVGLIAIWRCGAIAVPVGLSHPVAERQYVLTDSGATLLLVDSDLVDMFTSNAHECPAVTITRNLTPTRVSASRILADDPSLIVYTSGTTGRPKGVVHTHRSLASQITTLVRAWGWSNADRALLTLPLHHVHGLVNVLLCALWAGAPCDILPKFEPRTTWERLAHGNVTVYMAVPTIYRRLLAELAKIDHATRHSWTAGVRHLRLMVSGSAALPVSTLAAWREATGHDLLERYGMTEFGMALSNPLESERRAGWVGIALPGVEVRLVDDHHTDIADDVAGELWICSPSLFSGYWNRPAETVDAFEGRWFKTGDTAVRIDGWYRILGRTSIDILNPGGYKVSALEIEECLRTHPLVQDCAVLGIDEPTWGETIHAFVEVAENNVPTADMLRAWTRKDLAPYKVPRTFHLVPSLPRNAMGKVMKQVIRENVGNSPQTLAPQ